MTRNQAIEIARQRALNAREGHGYLPVTEADAQTWMPHEWVIDAILLATMQCDLAAQQPCQYCNDTGDVHGLDGEWQGTCTACKWGAARPAAQPVALTVDEKAALDRALLRSVKIVDEAAQPVAWLQPATVDSHIIPDRFETCDPGDYAAFPVYRAAQQAAQPVAALMRSRYLRTRASIAHDGQDHFSDWGRWCPTTIEHAKAVTDPSRNTDPKLYEMVPLFAAAQPQQAEGDTP